MEVEVQKVKELYKKCQNAPELCNVAKRKMAVNSHQEAATPTLEPYKPGNASELLKVMAKAKGSCSDGAFQQLQNGQTSGCTVLDYMSFIDE